ncbi:MAG: 3-methyl-2-oxobutanoate dehydrogenase subunit VorB [Deltaproteobacteria bacterium]|nr:3-methyl-2-oxobutanoate dehydrogenase subunit VorB [Deltaproteobacteria bacterium]
MSGNHVIGEAAVRAGCSFYAGYPITPQNELTEYMAGAMAKLDDGTFIQAESEIAAINMLIGASMAGARVMTSSSSPGISLKQEGISFLSALELPAVIVNCMRGGPGLGNIAPSQGDYFQATRGGGHGDYRNIVLGPASGQEICDLVTKAFDYADEYLTPVMILLDGMMGQMMEPVVFPEYRDISTLPEKTWKIDGAKGRPRRVIKSLLLDVNVEEAHNWKLVRRYEQIKDKIQMAESYKTSDAKLTVIAYGIAARIAKSAVDRAREEGIKAGLLRPVTLWPFPERSLREAASNNTEFLVYEMSTGQMIEDVRLSLNGSSRIHFHGRPGGPVSTPADIYEQIKKYYPR